MNNNQVKQWSKRRDTKLFTLRFPASPQAIRKFLKTVEDFGEDWDEQIQYDPEGKWMFAEFEMGTGLNGGGEPV